MRNINKSEIRYVIRRAIEAFTQGRDALAVLNAQAVNIGLAGGVGEAEGRRLQTAYTQRGEEGAVATALAMLRDFGYTVTDDEAAAEQVQAVAGAAIAGEIPLGTAQVADTTPVVEEGVLLLGAVKVDGVDFGAVAQNLATNLFEGGRNQGISYVLDIAGSAGLTVTNEQATKIVTDFADALRDNGIYSAEEALEEAYEALTATPEVAQAGGEETLEVRVARLEQIARDNGLL